MDKRIIFSDSIIFSEIKDNELDEIILRILKEQEDANQGVVKSNRKGFQTDTIDNFYLSKTFTEKAGECLKENYNIDKKTKITLLNLWINKNYKESYNSPHIHPKCNFSGVYYVNASEKEGKLIFLRNDKTAGFTDNHMHFEGTDFHNTYEIQPKNNMFVLFSAHLDHMVEPHYDDEPRISVSFNFGLSND
tara:strand:- start:59 stop:631 length:573 start_codon:yes stop_codon:yes gene_type:complete